MKDVLVDHKGVTFRVTIAPDPTWKEWREEAIYVDDSERDLFRVIEATPVHDELLRLIDREVNMLLQEKELV